MQSIPVYKSVFRHLLIKCLKLWVSPTCQSSHTGCESYSGIPANPRPPKVVKGRFLLLLLWRKNLWGLVVHSPRSDLDWKVIQELRLGAQLVNADNQDGNQDENCCPLAMQFGPARALQTGFGSHRRHTWVPAGTAVGRLLAANSERVLTPTTTVSFPRNAAADCCSNTFTVQVLRQVVRRNCESVHWRSPGRTQASEWLE